MVALSSCTHNNGDIGPYFGTWKMLSVEIDGEVDAGYSGNVFWKFQNKVVCMLRVNEENHTTTECWGTWEENDNVLQLNFTHEDYYHKPGSSYYSPLPETYLPSEQVLGLDIISLSGSSMQLKYVTAEGKEIEYKFKKW